MKELSKRKRQIITTILCIIIFVELFLLRDKWAAYQRYLHQHFIYTVEGLWTHLSCMTTTQ